MTDIILFQIIDIFSWNILYIADLLVRVLVVFEVDMATKNLKIYKSTGIFLFQQN